MLNIPFGKTVSYSGLAMATEAPPVPSPTTAAAPPNAGIFDGYLTGAFTAGAFLGSVIVQIVTTGLMAPARMKGVTMQA